MSLVPGKVVLDAANKGGYAIGAFNFNNMEILQAIIDAAEEEKSPVIIAASEGAIKYAGLEMLVGLAETAAEKVGVPVALHLDHGTHYDIILRCLRAGFTSVMIDASSRPFDENVKLTKQIVDIAHPMGVSVEAELGRLMGIEDNISVAERDAVLVDPDQAEKFVELTGVDSLAPAIGTSHGAFKFKGEAKLDFDRLKKVKEKTGIPLVLHGASGVPRHILDTINRFGGDIKGAKGLPAETLQKAIAYGINKVNTDTDLRLAFTGAIREVLAEKKEVFDPRKILGPAREKMKEVIKERMRLFGSVNKA